MENCEISDREDLWCEREFGAQAVVSQSKRKEKARIAARARRSQEAQIIMEMADELGISQERLKRIDKATIVRMSIDYIKAHETLCGSRCPPRPVEMASVSRALFGGQHQERAESQSVRPVELVPVPLTSQCAAERKQESRKLSSINSSTSDGSDSQDYPMPKLSTRSIFAPKTQEMDSHFLMLTSDEKNGRSKFVLKPDYEILDEDDLTHLAPQAGDTSISLEVEPLDSIKLDRGLFTPPYSSPPHASMQPFSPSKYLAHQPQYQPHLNQHHLDYTNPKRYDNNNHYHQHHRSDLKLPRSGSVSPPAVKRAPRPPPIVMRSLVAG